MSGDKKYFQSWKVCVHDDTAFVRTSVGEVDDTGGGMMGGSVHIVKLGRLNAALSLLGVGDRSSANVALLGDVKFSERGRYLLEYSHLSTYHLAWISVACAKDTSFTTVRQLRQLIGRIKFKDDGNMIEDCPFPTRSEICTVDCLAEIFRGRLPDLKAA